MPDTEYKFWVEGFYCDGTSSKSEPATFRTKKPSSASVGKQLRYCWFEPRQPNPPIVLAISMKSIVLRFDDKQHG